MDNPTKKHAWAPVCDPEGTSSFKMAPVDATGKAVFIAVGRGDMEASCDAMLRADAHGAVRMCQGQRRRMAKAVEGDDTAGV